MAHHYNEALLWENLFTGKILDEEKQKALHEQGFILVDALMNTSEGDVMYRGILEEYFLSQNDGLKYLIFSAVSKKYLNKEVEYKYANPHATSGQHRPPEEIRLSGDRFMIPVSKAKNLQIEYFWLESDKWSE